MQKISFNDRYGLTQAVLDGRKPMTRRTEKSLKLIIDEYERINGEPFRVIHQEWNPAKRCITITTPNGQIDYAPKYKMSEVVAVAQSYKDCGYKSDAKYGWCYDENEKHKDVLFKDVEGWNNKMFVKAHLMPHQIKITDIRIERLQDITKEDCMKEGIITSQCYLYTFPNGYEYCNPKMAFAALINRPGVGRKGLWESNPWVVVYEFKLIKK